MNFISAIELDSCLLDRTSSVDNSQASSGPSSRARRPTMSDESNDDFEFDDDVEGIKSPRIDDREEFSYREEDGESLDDDDDRKDDEEEPDSDYELGGYHPVNLGDVFDTRYYILRKLGWGHFATVWLSFDSQKRGFAAIKIPKSRQDFIEASRDELEILAVIRDGDRKHIGYDNVVHVLNEFEFIGVSRSLHLCMVFEVLGDNLLTLLRKFTILNLNLCRVISRQVLQGLAFLHDDCEIIHTDIKPENVVLCLTPGQLRNLAIDAFKARNDPKPPKCMVSTAPDKYRQKYMQGIPTKVRKKMRKTRKKNRDRVAAFLHSLGMTDDDEENESCDEKNNHENSSNEDNAVGKVNSNNHDVEMVDAGGDTAIASINNGKKKSKTMKQNKGTDSTVNCKNIKPEEPNHNKHDTPRGNPGKQAELNSPSDMFDHITLFHEELHKGNMTALKEVKVKIVDFGNACYVNHHFTEEIQTREYRSPEAILGSPYNTSADIWSTACLIFELVSGEYLFYPEASVADDYDIDDDHIAKMIEILGPMPPNLFRDGRRYREIFDINGRLQRIRYLQPTTIVELLMDVAQLPGIEARLLSEFLTPMFAYDINTRAPARECLKSNWLELSEMRGTRPRRRLPLQEP